MFFFTSFWSIHMCTTSMVVKAMWLTKPLWWPLRPMRPTGRYSAAALSSSMLKAFIFCSGCSCCSHSPSQNIAQLFPKWSNILVQIIINFDKTCRCDQCIRAIPLVSISTINLEGLALKVVRTVHTPSELNAFVALLKVSPKRFNTSSAPSEVNTSITLKDSLQMVSGVTG